MKRSESKKTPCVYPCLPTAAAHTSFLTVLTASRAPGEVEETTRRRRRRRLCSAYFLLLTRVWKTLEKRKAALYGA